MMLALGRVPPPSCDWSAPSEPRPLRPAAPPLAASSSRGAPAPAGTAAEQNGDGSAPSAAADAVPPSKPTPPPALVPESAGANSGDGVEEIELTID